MNYNELLDKLKNRENFSYSRFGDGEWNAILGKEGQNCDGHRYFRDMGERLKKIVQSKPLYYLGCQNLAKKQNKDKPEFQRLFNLNSWIDNEILTRASIKGRLQDFFDVLDTRAVILVANYKVLKLNAFDYYGIEIPEKNCWLSYTDVLKKIHARIRENYVILYCASMMSGVLIDTIYKQLRVTQIDCGSVFDPYVGIQSRTYMKDLKI
jgi:hypothetical protein